MNISDELKRLYLALDDARKAKAVVENEISEAIQQARSAILEQYADRLRVVTDAHAAASRAANEQEDRERTENAKPPYPLGTVLIEWSRGYVRFSSDKKKPLKPTGRKGVMEQITATSVHPNNMGDYSRAAIGEIVVRLLKADGTPSLKYEQQRSGGFNHAWHPDGVDPNQKGASP